MKKCEVCIELEKNDGKIIIQDGFFAGKLCAGTTIRFNFCPMCGRKLNIETDKLCNNCEYFTGDDTYKTAWCEFVNDMVGADYHCSNWKENKHE